MSMQNDEALIWHQRRENWHPQPEDAREPGDIDYARIVHSASFRRLQGKTQILNLGDSDFYRTRLTHSLEVAQIASSITRQFERSFVDHPALSYLPGPSLIQAIGSTHDLGHPPFGHGGEVALNYCMREAGGFEGNGQTLRILTKLEKFSANHGSNLARRTLLGVLKYPISFSTAFNTARSPQLVSSASTIKIIDRKQSKPPKCYLDSEEDVVSWILDPLSNQERDLFCSFESHQNKHSSSIHKSLDCSIMDIADDISFGVHDLEDALALGLIGEGDFRRFINEENCSSFLSSLKEKYPGESQNDVYENLVRSLFSDGKTRKRFVSRMIHHFVTNCKLEAIDGFDQPLLHYRAKICDGPALFLNALKGMVRELVILSPSVQHLEFKGQNMVVTVFEVLLSEPKAFLPRDTLLLYEASSDPIRVVCDHIAGMTDGFLMKTYDRLLSPRVGSVFDKL